MQIKVVGSGSKGNCYLLISDSGRVLVLDAGMPIIEVKKALNFNIKCIDGVFVSHEHKDHDGYAKDFEKIGFFVWKPFLNSQKVLKKQIGTFGLTSFDVPHDGVENRGVIIEVDGQKILYVTDFEFCPYSFKKSKIEHFIVECNYISEMVDLDAENKDHVFKGHCEMRTALKFLVENQTDKTKSITFCHLSEENCNSETVMKEAKKITDSNIHIAKNGMKIELGCPF